jgi:hypothetical protein
VSVIGQVPCFVHCSIGPYSNRKKQVERGRCVKSKVISVTGLGGL